jgi:biopolymer transport protein ExbD
MARRSFLRRGGQSQDMSLQITSMADIFTIILIFLLKSYSVGALEASAPKGVQLPQATAGTAGLKSVADILRLEVSEGEVLVNGKPTASLSDFAFPSSDITGDGASRTLISKLAPATEDNAKVLVVADQRAPYETIKAVLASAALRGYTDVKLAVSPVDEGAAPARSKSAPAVPAPGKKRAQR